MSERESGSQRPHEEIVTDLRRTAGKLEQGFGRVKDTLRMDTQISKTGRAFVDLGPDVARFGELLVEWNNSMNRPLE